MPVTQVRDEQLNLSSVDQTVKLNNDTDALRLEANKPQLTFRETDQLVDGGGLWRLVMIDKRLFLERNTAVAGDFSTTQFVAIFRTDPPEQITFYGEMSIKATEAANPALRFDVGATAASVREKSLFLSGADDRLHFKTPANDDRVVIYREDIITRETPSGTIDGVNTIFTLTNTPITGSEMVFLNGMLQDAGASNDYTISGATITFSNAPILGDKIRVSYLKLS